MIKILMLLITLSSISYGIDGSSIAPLNISNDSTFIIGKQNQETPSLLTFKEQDVLNHKLIPLGKFHVFAGTVGTVFSTLGLVGSIFVIANAKHDPYALTSGILSCASSSVTLTIGILEIRIGLILQR
jgi:hypothetical protein